MIIHYDLFAGIGGFSLALEEIFSDQTIRHIFCEWESFPTSVLRQHWPDGEYWGDIAQLVAHSHKQGLERGATKSDGREEHQPHNGSQPRDGYKPGNFTIVTGGFPCQPFSAAGRRRGTADDRYQWPNMFAVIRHTKPEWVIAENVRGLVTWNDGLVLETVCADLEAQGYEVQPFIIPAVAVGAPHRRDRVWIIGRKVSFRPQEPQDTFSQRSRGRSKGAGQVLGSKSPETKDPGPGWPDWNRNWQEVAFATCDDSVDDGLSRLVDGVPHSRAKWRQESLKAYGNGIVPQVAMEIMLAIRESIYQ